MRSIAVTKPDMGVLSRERLLLSPFGTLAQAFGEELLARAEGKEGQWPFVPLDLREEDHEAPAYGAVSPGITLQVDLQLVLEALRREGGVTEQEKAAQRIVERILQHQEKREEPAAQPARPVTVTGTAHQTFYQVLNQNISITSSGHSQPALQGQALGETARRSASFSRRLQVLREEGQAELGQHSAFHLQTVSAPEGSTSAGEKAPSSAPSLLSQELTLLEEGKDRAAGEAAALRAAELAVSAGLEKWAENAARTKQIKGREDTRLTDPAERGQEYGPPSSLPEKGRMTAPREMPPSARDIRTAQGGAAVSSREAALVSRESRGRAEQPQTAPRGEDRTETAPQERLPLELTHRTEESSSASGQEQERADTSSRGERKSVVIPREMPASARDIRTAQGSGPALRETRKGAEQPRAAPQGEARTEAVPQERLPLELTHRTAEEDASASGQERERTGTSSRGEGKHMAAPREMPAAARDIRTARGGGPALRETREGAERPQAAPQGEARTEAVPQERLPLKLTYRTAEEDASAPGQERERADTSPRGERKSMVVPREMPAAARDIRTARGGGPAFQETREGVEQPQTAPQGEARTEIVLQERLPLELAHRMEENASIPGQERERTGVSLKEERKKTAASREMPDAARDIQTTPGRPVERPRKAAVLPQTTLERTQQSQTVPAEKTLQTGPAPMECQPLELTHRLPEKSSSPGVQEKEQPRSQGWEGPSRKEPQSGRREGMKPAAWAPPRTARDIRMRAGALSGTRAGSSLEENARPGTALEDRSGRGSIKLPSPEELTLGAQGDLSAPTPAYRRAAGQEEMSSPLSLTYVPAQPAQGPQPPQGRNEETGGQEQESEYARRLPDWAKQFFKNNALHTQQADPMSTARRIDSQAPAEPEETIQWTAPNYQPPGVPMTFRQKREEPARGGGEEIHISQAELQQTADKVYRMIEDRIRRERHRLGL